MEGACPGMSCWLHQASHGVAQPPRKRKMFSEVSDQSEEGAKALKLRVLARDSPLFRYSVRAVNVNVATREVAVCGLFGGPTCQVAFDDLEVLSDEQVFSAVSAAVHAAEAEDPAQLYLRGTFVKVVGGDFAVQFRSAYLVVMSSSDGFCTVALPGQGRVKLPVAHIQAAVEDPFNCSQRLSEPLPIPDSKPWSASQHAVLHDILVSHKNVELTGPPGAGKTEIGAMSALAFVKAGYGDGLIIAAVSNSIADEITRRYERAGLHDAQKYTGTLSAKLWAVLGTDFRHDNVVDIAEEILTMKYTEDIRRSIQRLRHLILEEDSTTLPHFKDVLLKVLALVRGMPHSSLQGGNIQITVIKDDRQLGGIQVEDGLAGDQRNYSADYEHGEAKETRSFESQCLQAYYPGMQVDISAEHFPVAAGMSGQVLLWCSLRQRYVVICAQGTDRYWDEIGRRLVHCEFVNPCHLSPALSQSTASVFVKHFLHSGSYRVGREEFDPSIPMATQPAKALMREAVQNWHDGCTGTPAIRELVARMLDAGKRMLVERPDWYEVTTFAYTWNRKLEEYAVKEHVQR